MRVDSRQRLIELLNIQSKSGHTTRIRGYMRKALEDAGMEVVRNDKQLFAKKGDPDAPHPIFVAHSDTVHKIVPPQHYAVGHYMDKGDVVYHAYDPVTKVRRGVGGDDKCGLWVALEAAHALDHLGVIITVDEEVGCVGAKRITPQDVGNASILIQADRKENKEAVRKITGLTISSEEWQSQVQSSVLAHGYDWCNFGMNTDVGAIAETVHISAVNLAAGYYSPHTDNEYVKESDLENCFELALQIAHHSREKQWKHVPARSTAYTSYQGTGNGFSFHQSSLREGIAYHGAEWKPGGKWNADLQLFEYDDGSIGAVFNGRYRYYDQKELEKVGDIEAQKKEVARFKTTMWNGRHVRLTETGKPPQKIYIPYLHEVPLALAVPVPEMVGSGYAKDGTQVQFTHNGNILVTNRDTTVISCHIAGCESFVTRWIDDVGMLLCYKHERLSLTLWRADTAHTRVILDVMRDERRIPKEGIAVLEALDTSTIHTV